MGLYNYVPYFAQPVNSDFFFYGRELIGCNLILMLFFSLWSLWFFHTLLGSNIASQSVVAVGFVCVLCNTENSLNQYRIYLLLQMKFLYTIENESLRWNWFTGIVQISKKTFQPPETIPSKEKFCFIFWYFSFENSIGPRIRSVIFYLLLRLRLCWSISIVSSMN